MTRWRTYLNLGRVSNVPTVWTNTIAGAALAKSESSASVGILAALGAAFSLFYVGGMFLNDAFDRGIDARLRPERPIPSGRVTAREVFAGGFGLLAGGVGGVAVVSTWITHQPTLPSVLSALGLAATITLYDVWHKGNPLSPIVMGACRALIYVTASVATVGRIPPPVFVGAGALVAYLVGLTYLAKHEGSDHRALAFGRMWPLALLFAPFAVVPTMLGATAASVALLVLLFAWVLFSLVRLRSGAQGAIPRAVVGLIAGISLLDGAIAATQGSSLLALVGLAGFVATLFLQRYVSGT
jgi:4-hydroxybenzoate polyprenyltransferase